MDIGTSINPMELRAVDTLCTFQAQVAITSIAPSYTPLSLRLLGVIHKFSSGEGKKKNHRYSRISSRYWTAVLLRQSRVEEMHDCDGGYDGLGWY